MVEDNKKMMNFSQIQEQIMALYPNKYDMSSILYIFSYIGSLLKNHREAKRVKRNEKTPTTRRWRYTMTSTYAISTKVNMRVEKAVNLSEIEKEVLI